MCGEIGITEEYYNGVRGYFDREQAEELYDMINEARQETIVTTRGDNRNTVTSGGSNTLVLAHHLCYTFWNHVEL